MNFFGYGMNIFRNRFLWKKNNGNFGFGMFLSFEAIGVELLFKYGGVILSIPFFVWHEDLDMEEIDAKNYLESIGEYLILSCVSAGISYFYKFVIKRAISLFKIDKKKLIREEHLAQKRLVLNKVQDNYKKCLNKIIFSANKYHKFELEKKEKGLIIHLALYGKFDNLHKFKKDLNFFSNKIKNASSEEYNINIMIKEKKMKEECMDIDNEIVDVTLPIRNKISCKEGNTLSFISFREKSISKIFGFYNPIFKSEEIPYILIA